MVSFDRGFSQRKPPPVPPAREVDRVEAERYSPNGGLRAILAKNGWTPERRAAEPPVVAPARPRRTDAALATHPPGQARNNRVPLAERQCGAEGCARNLVGGGRGLCSHHYQRLRADEREARGEPRWPNKRTKQPGAGSPSPQARGRATQADLDRAADRYGDLQDRVVNGSEVGRCEHGKRVIEFGDCQDCVAALESELNEMEAADPVLKAQGDRLRTLGEYWAGAAQDGS